MSAEPVDPIDASPFASLAELFGLEARRYAWRAYGACRTRPDLNWFPGYGESLTEQRQVCASCPVQKPCLAAALNNNEHDGIWGGTSERDRRRLRRNANPRPDVAARVVEHLAEIGGTFHGGGAALAPAIGVHATTVNQAIGRLEAAGHVTVDPPSPRGRGVTIRSITLNRSTP